MVAIVDKVYKIHDPVSNSGTFVVEGNPPTEGYTQTVKITYIPSTHDHEHQEGFEIDLSEDELESIYSSASHIFSTLEARANQEQ